MLIRRGLVCLSTRGVRANSKGFIPVVICWHECDLKNSCRVWRNGDSATNPREACDGYCVPSAQRVVGEVTCPTRQPHQRCQHQPPVCRDGPPDCENPQGVAKAGNPMKMAAIPSPALCRQPLIEASRSTTQAGAIRMKQHSAGFLGRIVAKLWAAIISPVPVGFEDETGFHYGMAEVPLPRIRAGRLRDRIPDKARLPVQWKAARTRNLNSGRRLVLQWDSSSLPPCRLSPESFSTKSCSRHLAERKAKAEG